MTKSLHFQIRGTVQGVGFRPWIFRLAHQHHLTGFVRNTSQGALIEIEGAETEVENFVHLIRTEPPAHCVLPNVFSLTLLPKVLINSGSCPVMTKISMRP